MSIQQLPEDVVAQIKSSTSITSLNGVVSGLIKNSLDAGATKITVSVDYVKGNCSVEDNGSGILPAEFASTGGLGKPHCKNQLLDQLDPNVESCLSVPQIRRVFHHIPEYTEIVARS